jgi:ubiquinone biosynthesis accessory factor UbiK
MTDKPSFDDLAKRIREAMRNSPFGDVERNLRALLVSFFDSLDLVTREEFDVQKQLLEQTQQKLAQLETRLAELSRDAPPPRG